MNSVTRDSGRVAPSRARPLLAAGLTLAASLALLGLTVAPADGSRVAHSAPSVAAPAPPAVQLDRMLHQIARANRSFPGVALAIRSPRLTWSGAAGVADRASRTPLTTDATFRIASLTKTFTAAAVLRLVEVGELALDDPVSRHLSRTSAALLRQDGYDPETIRVRHLLQHTSGLAGDYAELEPYLRFIVNHPRHRWTRTEQIRFVMAHSKPLARPGKAYHYSDTGYVLLGEMLERLTGRGLGAAYRTLLHFDRLGLDETHLETLEPTPAGAKPRAHQYLGTLDMTNFDPSFDIYGAGGHVSTLDDLARFYRALVEGRVLARASSLRDMLGKPRARTPDDLPMGIDRAPLDGETCFGHGGFWGVAAYHCPRTNVTVVTSITQAEGFIPPTARLLATAHRLALRAT